MATVVLPLVIVVLVPVVLVAGLTLGVHGSTGQVGTRTGTGGISVQIEYYRGCVVALPDAGAAGTVTGAGHSPSPGAGPGTCPILPPLTIHLSALVTGGAPPYAIVWSFGDGSGPGLGQVLNHTFPACEIYVVSVAVADLLGTASNSTTVLPCPP